jgi:hypothetical protein
VILRRVLLLVAAVAALMTATGVITTAIAFAVYAAFEPMIGRAYAAAATAGIFAALIGLAALILVLMVEGKRRRSRTATRPDAGLTDQIMGLIREKPFAAAGIAAAAGLMAMRNPRMIGAVLGAFLEGWRGGAAMRKKP